MKIAPTNILMTCEVKTYIFHLKTYRTGFLNLNVKNMMGYESDCWPSIEPIVWSLQWLFNPYLSSPNDWLNRLSLPLKVDSTNSFTSSFKMFRSIQELVV